MWNRLPIRHKLLVTLMLVALAALSGMGWIGYLSGEQSLRRAAFDQLTAVRAAKAQQIENYFADLREEVAILAQAQLVVACLRDLPSAVAELEASTQHWSLPIELPPSLDEYYENIFFPKLDALSPRKRPIEFYKPNDGVSALLQQRYISDNPHPLGQKDLLDASLDDSEYSWKHARCHPIFREARRRFGYYDLFLVDDETHRVVYSVFKETDFATRLDSGPYRESGLASAYRQALDAEEVVMVDFDFYEPSYGAPASFLAAAVHDDGERIGVLVIQIPIDRIDNIMTGDRGWAEDGLGESGETYLVGSDYLMRSDSRFALEDLAGFVEVLERHGVPADRRERVQEFGTTILLQEVRTEAVENALSGITSTTLVDDYRGIPVLSAYVPLEIEGVNWVMLSEIDADEAFAPIRAFAQRVLWTGLIVAILVVVASALVTRSLLRPIDALAQAARQVSAGDLDVKVEVASGDELGKLADTFNSMVSSIRQKTELITQKNRENEALLLNILPRSIADRLKSGEDHIADAFSDVSVLFADLVGFTELSRDMDPADLVVLLNGLFSDFDELAGKHRIEKIKTIGDAYMACAGLPEPNTNHAFEAAEMAIGMLEATRSFNTRKGTALELRIGINSGPVVAGVIGRSKFIYDLWGDTVNLASRMESHGVPGAIHISQATRDHLGERYHVESRGEIDLKGRGRHRTYLLIGRRAPEVG